jgi:ubiquinone biosynthesis accessory factor UbiJ
MAGAAEESNDNTPGGGNLFTLPLAAALNHLLEPASWARERLTPHAGKTVCFDVSPLSFSLEILPSGEVSACKGAATTTFELTPALAMRMAATGETAWREVKTRGDLALARDVLFIAQNLRWDAEEDLSRVLGDIVAHRLANAGGALLRWQRDTVKSLARQASTYWTEEQPLIAAKADLDQFGCAVDTLRDDVARVEKRLEQLERQR